MNRLCSPFSHFSVVPFYGKCSAVVQFTLEPESSGSVYLYRSIDGVEWVLANEGYAITGGSPGEFIDTKVPNDDPFAPLYYRGMLDSGGAPETWRAGPIIAAHDRLTRKEHMICREVMRREYKNMSGPKGDGQRVFHYVPLNSGEPADGYWPETGQIVGPPCPDDPDSGYGLPYKGGFSPPLQTWITIISMDPEVIKDSEDETGWTRDASVKFRMLAYPKPDSGHMIVFADSDRRYLIDSPIERFFLRGTYPLFWEAKGLLLDKNDPRYQIKPPAFRPDPEWVQEYRID